MDQDPKLISESTHVRPQVLKESAQALQESEGSKIILPKIEAIHAGTTRNSTRYVAERLRGSQELKSGVFSWTQPYAKPIIYNHDVNTEATGRVQSASFSEYTQAGRPGIIVIPRITHEKAIQDVLEGRLLTVSIGANTDAVTCSVCGTEIISEGFCGHFKGETYEGTKAEWIIGNVWFDELSWVNVPSDQDAMVIDQGSVISTAESFAIKDNKEIINLGLSTKEWTVAESVANKEGLVQGKSEEEDEVTLKEQLAKAQEELETTKESLVKAEEKVATLEEAKKELEEEKKSLETKVTESEELLTTEAEKLTNLEEEMKTLKEEKESLEEEKKNLTESLEEEKNAREEVVEENTKITAKLKQSLVERVADLRVQVGLEENEQDAVAKLSERSTESLKDSLADLKEQAKSIKNLAATGTTVLEGRTLGSVQNPGSNDDIKEKELEQTESAMKSLFSGLGAKK